MPQQFPGRATTIRGASPPAIVFGVLVDDKVMQWPGRNQLMRSMAKHTSVVLLERTDRTRRYFDIPLRPHIEQRDEALFVIKNAFSLRTHRVGRHFWRLAGVIDARWFRRAMREAGLSHYIMWLTVNDPVLSFGVDSDRLVYDCMDPNFLPEQQENFDRTESAIAVRASVVFASAATLFRRMQRLNRNTYLLPNAAAVNGDGTRTPARASRPAALSARPGPVVGYLGTIDWRFDAEYVTAAAAALPDITFAVVGRVNADQEAKVAELRRLPNVVMPGQVGMSEGISYTDAFDVGLIPFTPSAMNDAINPVKMYMYLAEGMPVVSTWIAECEANPFVTAARTKQEFADAIRTSLDDRSPAAAEARKRFASANTWDHRALAAIDVLSEHGMWD